MKIRRILSAAIALVMVLALIPMAAIAEGIDASLTEARAMRKLDNVWAELEAAEREAIDAGLSRADVITAVYTAALNIDAVDKDSFSDSTNDGFFFTVDGMYCSYNFRLRNELKAGAEPVSEDEYVVITKGGREAVKNGATSANVLLIAPYYGHDSSFTDQYKNEAQSIAETTGGDYTLIQSAGATGPAIAENFPDKGVVIYDSHGVQTGTSSYLCLTTDAGITQNDYNNGWAVNAGGGEAYIDGRYVENHVEAALSNTFVWMAICQGMKKGGKGTTGAALLRAGAGVVYGYSQNVTFKGDYEYEAEFWTHMKDGETASEAFEAMIDRYGVPDPYGSAYPIIMSSDDEYPENPDALQQVNSDWCLLSDLAEIPLEDYALSSNEMQIYLGNDGVIDFNRDPYNANNYTLEWISSNPKVATVAGNFRKATITTLTLGRTTITCNIYINGEMIGTETCEVRVVENTLLRDALNVEGGLMSFGASMDYPFVAASDGDRNYAMSSNQGVNDSVSELVTTIDMKAGETLKFEYLCSSESQYDFFRFYVNGTENFKTSGTAQTQWKERKYTAPSDGTYTFKWVFEKDAMVNSGNDCVKIDNVEYSGTLYIANGDVNGDGVVDVNDVLLAMRISLGIVEPTVFQNARGDLNANGTLDVTDVNLILRMSLGIAD